MRNSYSNLINDVLDDDYTAIGDCVTWQQVQNICTAAINNNIEMICIPSCYVKSAKIFIGKNNVKIATLISFPYGNDTTSVKVLSTIDAVKNGADVILMTVNKGLLRNQNTDAVKLELKSTKDAACDAEILYIINKDDLRNAELGILCSIAKELNINCSLI